MRLSLSVANSVFLVAALCAQCDQVNAAEAAEIAFFEQKIRPLLAAHCYECHSEQVKSPKGGLLLDSLPGWKQAGDSGEPIIVPGDANASLLIKAVRHEAGLEMPPDKKLSDEQIADLVAWINQGAADPRDGKPLDARRADKSWWSLQPISIVSPPAVSNAPVDWQVNPIDSFIYEKLTAQNLAPNPHADARTLIRRMSFDVIGLPPTPEEVTAFEKRFVEDRDAAVTELVDRLLASPHYGERWGRHWLDIVRFGESNGFERNVLTPDIWPFRDYVIRSFNADKPFNQFISEHLAGDVIGRDDPAVEVGVAFLVAGPYDDVGNQDAVAAANIRAATLDDIIGTTSGAFLGMTVNCARCHDHKFDPIPTEDYYRLRAAFEGVTHGSRVLATPEEKERRASAVRPLEEARDALISRKNSIQEKITARAKEKLSGKVYPHPKLSIPEYEVRFEPVRAQAIKFVMQAHTGNANSAVGSKLVEFEVWSDETNSRNVALASLGAKAEGARAVVAEDFAEAYGPQLVIDGQSAEQWFVGDPAELTITFAQPELINRIVVVNSRETDVRVDALHGETPTEFEVSVSADGANWTKIAASTVYEPWSEAHAIERIRRDITTVEEQAQLSQLNAEIDELNEKLANIPNLPVAFAGNFQQPTAPTVLHKGGDPTKPGDVILPASLGFLASVPSSFVLPSDTAEGERRAALARWMTDDDNPLPPRVLANRLWHYHFGVGIVDTPSDFGFLGGRPTHPELLDYLASQLIAHKWRLKPLHREILLSQTYRQSSAMQASAAMQDGEARLLWRFPPRRLSAEEIRDSMLFVTGKLNLADQGGPGFRLYKHTQNNVCTYFPLDVHGPDTYRRAVYHQNVRASVVDVLTDFDLPDNALAAPRRVNTVTPLQALTLFNHRFSLDMAGFLAERARQEQPENVAGQIDCIYNVAFQRSPTEQEANAAQELVASHGLIALCRAVFNLNEFIYVE